MKWLFNVHLILQLFFIQALKAAPFYIANFYKFSATNRSFAGAFIPITCEDNVPVELNMEKYQYPQYSEISPIRLIVHLSLA